MRPARETYGLAEVREAHYVAGVNRYAMLACACCHSPLMMRARGRAIAG